MRSRKLTDAEKLKRQQDQFDEWLAQVTDELTPEQAARILAKREKNDRARKAFPGSSCEILPSN